MNVEDKGCVERVYRGLCAGLSGPGPLSHLERPNYDFARYIDGMIRKEEAGALPRVDGLCRALDRSADD